MHHKNAINSSRPYLLDIFSLAVKIFFVDSALKKEELQEENSINLMTDLDYLA